MDIVTQGLLGGVLAQSVARYEEKKLATFVGFAAGMLADADVLIRSGSDPLLTVEYHRHFTHSLFFIPFGAAIAFLLLWPLLRKHASAPRLYLFCLAGYSLSGVLDACTSYGTQLFWPVSDVRVALNIISIVDPVFTGILLFTLLLELRIKASVTAIIGLILCVAYLGYAYTQLQQATEMAKKMAVLRGHQVEQLVVKPTIGNLILWRSVYINNQQIYVDAVRLGVMGDDEIIEGASVQRFDVSSDLPDLEKTSVLYNDIRRFDQLSSGFVARDPTQENVLGDIRYSLLPVSVKPLWGIVIDAAQPQQHADYQFFRATDRVTREAFINMLLGK